jgi:hypothetical protein
MGLILALCGLSFLGLGCMSRGGLYSNTIEPYTTDFHNTPVGTKECVLNEYEVQEPISGYGLSADVNFASVRQAAQNAGITNINYADVKDVSVLGGIYRMKRLIVYGE